MKCIICGNTDYFPNTSKFPKDFCSYKCYEEWCKFNKEPNCMCAICNTPMYLKPSRIARAIHGVTCSKECSNKLKSIYMQSSGNHRYGKCGSESQNFIGPLTISNYGYILEYCPAHPYPHDKSSKTVRVFQHRLIVERNYQKFDSKFFEEVNEMIVLKQEFVVHHINGDKQDNRLENLQIMSLAEHTALHNKEKIAISKSSNIGESCDANPEIISEIKESETSYSVENETT